MKRLALLLSFTGLLLAACTPGTGTVDTAAVLAALEGPCVNDPPPVVAVIDFENTTSRFGTTVTGVEEAATARLITLLENSDCYFVVERSVLQDLIAQQGLESTDPIELAKAAGAGFVVTGTVTRATIAEPQVGFAGISLGSTTAQVQVDVRATDIITGEVVVSEMASGEASSPNIEVSRIPGGTISYDDPTVGPLLAEASEQAVNAATAAIRTRF
jgi:curli biogenesis system outer membrane secretion channel CsgG